MSTTYKNILYTDEQITYMREWAKDCQWKEDEEDNSFLDDLTDLQILKGVENNYAGGLASAILDLTPVLLTS